MQSSKAIRDSKSVVLPFAVGLSFYSLVGLCIFLWLGKEETHQFLNSYHTPYLDLAFKYITHIGHGFIPVIAFHLLLLVRYSWALVWEFQVCSWAYSFKHLNGLFSLETTVQPCSSMMVDYQALKVLTSCFITVSLLGIQQPHFACV